MSGQNNQDFKKNSKMKAISIHDLTVDEDSKHFELNITSNDDDSNYLL